MRRLSVVLTAYNSASFITKTVESVLHQTLDNFELIAVDDGSTDGTAEILDSYSDRRLRVIHQDNQGPATSLNVGLRLAQYPYIALLDGDDCWHANKLRTHAIYLDEHPETDLAFDWSIWIDGAGCETGLRSRHCQGACSFCALLEDFVISTTSSIVLRRSALDRAGYCDPHFRRYYVADLVLRIALLREGNVHAIPQPLTYYRRHGAQMSRDRTVMREEWNALVEKFRSLAPLETGKAARKSASNMARYFAVVAYENGDFSEAAKILVASLYGAPAVFLGEWRNWQVTAATMAGLLLPAPAFRCIEGLAGIQRSGSCEDPESRRRR